MSLYVIVGLCYYIIVLLCCHVILCLPDADAEQLACLEVYLLGVSREYVCMGFRILGSRVLGF